MTIDLTLDRAGNVREMGTVVSRNILMKDPAVEAVKHWKFRPYLQNGAPVQVHTNITLRYNSRVELLGASSGKSYPVYPFLQRINKARQLSDPRMDGAKPFHLHGILKAGQSTEGPLTNYGHPPGDGYAERNSGA
jgi:hypothetical protein